MASAAPTIPGRVATFSSCSSEPSCSIASKSSWSANTRAGTRMSARASAGSSQCVSPICVHSDIEHHPRAPAGVLRGPQLGAVQGDCLDKRARLSAASSHGRTQSRIVELEIRQMLRDELLDLGQVHELVQPVDEQRAEIVRLELDRVPLAVEAAAVADELGEGGECIGEHRGLGRRLDYELELGRVLSPVVHGFALPIVAASNAGPVFIPAGAAGPVPAVPLAETPSARPPEPEELARRRLERARMSLASRDVHLEYV